MHWIQRYIFQKITVLYIARQAKSGKWHETIKTTTTTIKLWKTAIITKANQILAAINMLTTNETDKNNTIYSNV